ncbi:gliding motility lipoprotein GldD [Winogradskyella alexanderae]|uniref:Gliding motility lipoprotein GldD n=1 Tax=Winogradskyella alexanderae TaxID=2877123 RepID=A0ABS7XPV3_9FLAO|nr:gliding motility lipoprotein GldD [Winogradskyella alexanderae]MCA0131483.1 gliding motility lipoprotein GldD [Winogradskyella alexanderae]
MKKVLFPLFFLTLFSCGDDSLPKPNGYLRLDYPTAKYNKSKIPLPFEFDKNEMSEPIKNIKTTGEIKGIDIKYPSMKATIYLTYQKIRNNNLDSLLRDAQNLTQTHTIKADEILPKEFLSPENKVYGMLYEIGGDAASQSQFYLTDSISHFISGSLYFYAKPNYDSIYPASEYLKKDIKRLMETLVWKQ